MRKIIITSPPGFFAAWSLVLFLLSLFMPGFRFSADEAWFKFSSGNDPYPGLLILILGWTVITQGIVAWLANPLGAIGMLLYLRKRYSIALLFFIAALIFALSAFFLNEIPRPNGTIYSMGLGYYVWLAAIISILAGTILNLTRRSSGTAQKRAAP
jgi:hypothetical protein